ncbi:hypothetical protein K1719_015626 [Acacia pycnantha]|nr:hypothetical protein K1719_015626 [Acacia pycnantha]
MMTNKLNLLLQLPYNWIREEVFFFLVKEKRFCKSLAKSLEQEFKYIWTHSDGLMNGAHNLENKFCIFDAATKIYVGQGSGFMMLSFLSVMGPPFQNRVTTKNNSVAYSTAVSSGERGMFVTNVVENCFSVLVNATCKFSPQFSFVPMHHDGSSKSARPTGMADH